MRTKDKYFRGRFLIGIYASIQEGETLLALCETVDDFAKLMKIKESAARMILLNAYNKKTNHIVFAEKWRTIEFIDIFCKD